MSQPSIAATCQAFRACSRRCAVLAAALATLVVPLAAAAQEGAPAPYEPAYEDAGEVSFAAGVSMGFLRVQELGAVQRFRFIPSVVGLAYVPLAPRLFLRPGLRLSYEGLEQAQFSHGARMIEHS